MTIIEYKCNCPPWKVMKAIKLAVDKHGELKARCRYCGRYVQRIITTIGTSSVPATED